MRKIFRVLLCLIIIKIILIFLIFCINSYAEKIYYSDSDDDGIYSADVFFSGYDKNGDYVIVIDTNDYGVLYLTNSQFAEGIYFFEYRCIKPETAIESGIEAKPFQFICEINENCDCSKWQFYEDQYYYKILKEKSACFGYRRYSFEAFQELSLLLKLPQYIKQEDIEGYSDYYCK